MLRSLLGKSSQTCGAAAVALSTLLSGNAQAESLSAGFVVNDMQPDEQYTYVAGIAEGLAYMLFVADGRAEEPGMRCVYQWFYEEDGTIENIWAAFQRFPDHLPGAVMAALIQRRCGA